METKDILQLVAPFIAAGTAVLLARRQDRERVSCFMDWAYYWEEHGGPVEYAYVGIHNQSPVPIAVRSVQYLRGGLWRAPVEGTALEFEDPTDLGFPYIVQPGEIRTLALDEELGKKVIGQSWASTRAMNIVLRRPQILIQCRTTAGTRLRASGEQILPWDQRQSWARS